MKVKFFSHSCVGIYARDVGILCDPWFVGDVFNGGWALSPEPAVPTEDDLSRTTHLYLSHEHPDHFNMPTLAGFSDAFKRRVVVVFQRNNSNRKVSSALEKMGYRNFVDVGHMHRLRLSEAAAIYIYQHRHIDSALIVEGEGQTIVNLNDAELTKAECETLKAQFKSVDVLLTQFSIAGSEGYEESDRQAAAAVLSKLLEQSRTLEAKIVVPFASFVFFCKSDNSFLNTYANTCLDAKRVLMENNIRAHLLYPGSEIEVGKEPSTDDEPTFVNYYANRRLALRADDPQIAIYEIERIVAERVGKWRKHYPALIFDKVGNILFRIPDLGRTLEVDFRTGKVAAVADLPAHLTINSQPLYFAFAADYGIQTLGVSGRYRISSDRLVRRRWRLVRIVSSLYNAEIYLTLSGLLSPKMLRWVWERKTNLLGNIRQQVARVRGN